MDYRCLNCEWVGTQDDLIHDTLCPRCQSRAIPVPDGEDPLQQILQTAYASMTAESSYQ
jgi:Zn finger protein HypA/HybF involved in hydrogenase expression